VAFDAMIVELQPLIDKVWRHCENTGSRGRTVTMKVKFADFEIMSQSRSVPTAGGNRDDLERLAVSLLEGTLPLCKAVRLPVVSLSTLEREATGRAALDHPSIASARNWPACLGSPSSPVRRRYSPSDVDRFFFQVGDRLGHFLALLSNKFRGPITYPTSHLMAASRFGPLSCRGFLCRKTT
jgi:impB/mucB/samB family C-terminal domain